MIRVAVFNEHKRHRVRQTSVVQCVKRVMKKAGIRNAEITIVFVGSRFIRRINRRHLGHDEVTDVISFPLGEGKTLEGEVYVNLDRARHQARAFGVSVRSEVARLVIHGVLHLVGFDDLTPAAARRMTAEQEAHVAYWYTKRTAKKDR